MNYDFRITLVMEIKSEEIEEPYRSMPMKELKAYVSEEMAREFGGETFKDIKITKIKRTES